MAMGADFSERGEPSTSEPEPEQKVDPIDELIGSLASRGNNRPLRRAAQAKDRMSAELLVHRETGFSPLQSPGSSRAGSVPVAGARHALGVGY